MDDEDILRHKYRDVFICSNCVGEDDLCKFIATGGADEGCSFCGGTDAPTSDFLGVMDHVRTCIEREYDLAANCLAWESTEGGWLWNDVWDTYDLLTERLGIDFPRDSDRTLIEAMVECMGGPQDWCIANPYGEDPLAALRAGWSGFCELVRHETRFFLDRWKPSFPLGGVEERHTPASVLHAIGDRVIRLDLISELPTDTPLFRVRYCNEGRRFETPEDLGPPPRKHAIVSNRMSPPGVVMFYAALEPETAIAETADKPGLYAVATFRTQRVARVIDFTKLPRVPGFFADSPDSQAWSWRDAQFFQDLVEVFARPIKRDDRVHVEYIPTQVVTEYCRLQICAEYEVGAFDGILYPSSRNGGGTSIVLFCDQRSVVGIARPDGINADAWLELAAVDHREVSDREARALASSDSQSDKQAALERSAFSGED